MSTYTLTIKSDNKLQVYDVVTYANLRCGIEDIEIKKGTKKVSYKKKGVVLFDKKKERTILPETIKQTAKEKSITNKRV